jgi:1-acyl-sn-glycerol-3-phosphate acyltransferase
MGRGLSLYAVWQVARISVPTALDGLRGKVDRDVIDARGRSFAQAILAKARVQLEVIGADRVPTDRAYVYMSNHQSHIDVPVLVGALPSPTLRMVAKKELFRVPVWGRAMRAAGMVMIDRSDREAAIASLDIAKQQIADGVSVWIAPEGTRSRTGELGPLKRGGFHIAVDTGTPIVPVAIRGTRDVLPASSTSMAYDVPVRVTIGAPISVAGRDIDDLIAEIEAFLRAHA